jgi:hypothetical protein
MFDNILSAAALALIAAVTVAAPSSLRHSAPTHDAELVEVLPVVTLPTVEIE